MKLKDFVQHFNNKKNNQDKFEIKKLKMKEFDLTIDDLLNIKLKKKLKKFDEI